MNEQAGVFPCRTILSASRLGIRAAFVLALLLMLPGLTQHAAAQSFEIDCYATLQSYAATNPELRCTCASRTSRPNCSSGSSGSSHSTAPVMTTKQMVQLQVTSTVVDAFVNMLLSDNSAANAKKQQMMLELQQRQAEAAREQQIAEAARLAVICQRLQGTLKLSGTPGLTLKSDASAGVSSGLRLKMGDGDDGHAGQRGLPGIALNDNTGNGGSIPYGIAGLPGIYTNGPATPPTPPSGRSHSADGGLQLKLGDGAGASQSTTQAQATPAPTDAAQSAQSLDPLTMTPQQLADLAANLSPAQQQQLASALQAAQSGAVAAIPPSAAPGTVAHLSPTTTVSAAPAPTTTDTQGSTRQSPAGTGQAPGAKNSGALGQLNQTAAASLNAAHANTPEGMAAGAREGFDTAAGGATAPVHLGANGSPQTASGSAQSSNGISSAVAGATNSKPGGTGSYPVVDISVLKPPPPIANAPARPNAASNSKAQCVERTDHKLPTRQELMTELVQRRTELANLRQTIMRLNRTIQMDQKQFGEWQAEAEAGYDRCVNRVLSLPTKFAMDTFIEMYEERFKRAQNMKVLTENGMKQWNMLKRAKELKNFDDFQKWVLEDKSEIETYDEGIRQLIAALPVSAEVQSYVNVAEDLIDNSYDYVDLVSTWRNLNQLDRNSDQFLTAVRGNGLRMKSIMTRIQQIETQLSGVPPTVQLPYCSQ